MTKIVFKQLRMSIKARLGRYLLTLGVDSGIVSFCVDLRISRKDYLVLEADGERRSLLQAALHQPFQLQETTLSRTERSVRLSVVS